MPDLESGALMARWTGRCDWGRTIRPAAGAEPCPDTPTQILVINGPEGRRVVQICTLHGEFVDGHALPRLASVRLAESFGRQLLAMIAPEAARAAAAIERIQCDGNALGLTDDEISEVLDAWTVHYRERPQTLPLDQVRAAVLARAVGGDWRPPADGAVIDMQRLNMLLHELGVSPDRWASYYTPEAAL
jgi:hypothetical protein